MSSRRPRARATRLRWQGGAGHEAAVGRHERRWSRMRKALRLRTTLGHRPLPFRHAIGCRRRSDTVNEAVSLRKAGAAAAGPRRVASARTWPVPNSAHRSRESPDRPASPNERISKFSTGLEVRGAKKPVNRGVQRVLTQQRERYAGSRANDEGVRPCERRFARRSDVVDLNCALELTARGLRGSTCDPASTLAYVRRQPGYPKRAGVARSESDPGRSPSGDKKVVGLRSSCIISPSPNVCRPR